MASAASTEGERIKLSSDFRSILRLVGSLESRLTQQDKEIKQLNQAMRNVMSTLSLVIRIIYLDPITAACAVIITAGETLYSILTPEVEPTILLTEITAQGKLISQISKPIAKEGAP